MKPKLDPLEYPVVREVEKIHLCFINGQANEGIIKILKFRKKYCDLGINFFEEYLIYLKKLYQDKTSILMYFSEVVIAFEKNIRNYEKK
jgi:hypothetical protein